MPLSVIAGIVSRNGGVRVVVTERRRLRFHVNKGERAYIVPGVRVQEPVAWDKIPGVIEMAQQHVRKSQASWLYRIRSWLVAFTSAIARLGR